MDLWDCMRGKKRKRSGVKSGGKEKGSLITQVQPVNDGYQSVMEEKGRKNERKIKKKKNQKKNEYGGLINTYKKINKEYSFYSLRQYWH